MNTSRVDRNLLNKRRCSRCVHKRRSVTELECEAWEARGIFDGIPSRWKREGPHGRLECVDYMQRATS